jgi:hypothetical protein
MGNGFGPEERALEGIDGADVRLGRPGANGYADAGARDVSARPGLDLALVV